VIDMTRSPSDKPIVAGNSKTFALVVTADDFGIGRLTSEGIIQAHLRGPVTATSLMTVTGDHAKQSVPLLEQAPHLDVGLHLALTACGHGPLVVKQSSGIVGKDGCFFSNGRLWRAAFLGKISQQAVEEEIAAQAALFRSLVGREPTHVDCHHHAHQLPVIRDALAAVMARGILPKITRTTVEQPPMSKKVSGRRLHRRAAGWIGTRAAKLFSQRNIFGNDFFFGMLGPADFNRAFPWDRYLQNLERQGVVEWVVHPGLPDETLNGRDSYRQMRVRELESLTDPASSGQWKHLQPYLSRKSVLFGA
jgi:chitin disaccharide deacetylase